MSTRPTTPTLLAWKKNPAAPPKLRHIPQNNKATSKPTTFLILPRELRHTILLQSGKCDWLKLYTSDMFKYGKVHNSYLDWLPECWEEWRQVMMCVDEGLVEDVEHVIDLWEDGLTRERRERSAREFEGRMRELEIGGKEA
jgi:hypothetical protein